MEWQAGLLHFRVSIIFILISLRLCCCLEKISSSYLIVFLECYNGCLLSFSCDFKCLLTNQNYFSNNSCRQGNNRSLWKCLFFESQIHFLKVIDNEFDNEQHKWYLWTNGRMIACVLKMRKEFCKVKTLFVDLLLRSKTSTIVIDLFVAYSNVI